MANFLERMGLVKTEYDDVPIPMAAGAMPAMEHEDVPEIDASQVAYEDVIRSIYQQGGIDDTSSIFKIKSYIDILPPEMTTAKKQASIAGILAVDGINIHDLINDGGGRINVLEAAAQSIKDENDSVIQEAEADIEHLKSLIEAAETKIAESKKKTADACAAITEEVNSITHLLNFADGVAGINEGDS
ncbi:MAG: hypothetical protein NC548_41820 [Lachnospiraceae bacterium]|nr:hypothetical protein [Lachnospiraceae bacterium]